MTHLSDFSYIERGTLNVFFFCWMLERIWSTDKFACLHPRKIWKRELKSICTFLILLSVAICIVYDAIAIYVKVTKIYAQRRALFPFSSLVGDL